ncbi:MOSC domain-containing protein, partial [Syncephalis pseudoplumigaleata]
TAFADVFPCLLISEASLDDLNARLEQPVDMRRFRPNVVVAGSHEPYAEDGWIGSYLYAKDGTAGLYVANRCVRCVMPNVDPDQGAPLGLEPLRTLQSYRRVDPASKYKACFGVNLIP